MSDREHPEGLSEKIRVFYSRVHRLIDQAMRGQGISLARTKFLLFIEREGPVRSIDLADAFGHAPRTVTEAIDGLERDGLVQRVPDAIDRRAKWITVTEAGRVALRSSEPLRQAMIANMFEVLDAEEARMLGTLFDKLNARLEESTHAPSETAGP